MRELRFSTTRSLTKHRSPTTSKPSTRSKAHHKLLPTWTPSRRWESVPCSEITWLKTMSRVTIPIAWPKICSTSPYRRRRRDCHHSRPRRRSTRRDLRGMPSFSVLLAITQYSAVLPSLFCFGHYQSLLEIGVFMRLARIFSAIKRFVLCAILIGLFAAQAQQAQQNHGIAVADLDPSVKPGDDFFRYCDGAWLKRTEIPPDRSSLSVFSMLDDRSNKRTAALIEEVSKSNPPAGSGARKIADLHASFMDESGIETKGLSPLKPHLDAIAAIKDKHDLARALGESLRADEDPLNNTNYHTSNLFGLWVAPDFSGSEHYTAYLLQGGITLPDREYYLSDNEHMRTLRTQYQAHVTAMLKLAGFSNPEARAARIFELEHAIAEKHWSLADDQDVHKAYNPWKQSDFNFKAPGLDWNQYFRAAGLSQQENFIVWQPSAFAGESALVASTPLESWKDWLAYHVIEHYADALPKAFADGQFAFFDKELTGVSEQRPRWQRAVKVVNETLGDEVGKLYAQKYFPPEAKARAQQMVSNIVEAFQKRIDALAWMKPATKKEAHAKLSALYVGVGYPETWRDYSGLEIKPDDIFGNAWRSSLFEYHRQVSRLGKPVDTHEWWMTPQTVNAVNLPLQNALNFPAAILEPPFFDAKAPDASNYGAIGAIIGHEISH